MLVVIGGGPYGIATAATAIENGIETVVLGRPLGFWKDNMPEGMYLRSGPDWHLDASGVHTFEAFLEERGIGAAEIDPVPIAVFRDYAQWFQQEKGVVIDERLVTSVGLDGHTGQGDGAKGGSFQVRLDDETQLVADAVVAAPGVRYFQNRPDWSAGLPDGLCSHTCDLVRFNDFAGARVLIVGGRQSAYEWAALIGEHGAEQVDIVHRHEVPRFDRVSWRFADEYVERPGRPGLVAFAPGLGAGRDRPQVLGGRPPHPRVVVDSQAAGGAVPPPPRHLGCRRFGRRRGEGTRAAERRDRARRRPHRPRHRV